MMISACRPSWSRRAAGALAVVMTIVRAYAGAAVMSGLSGSRSSRPVTTAIGGVGGRSSRRWLHSSCGRAGLYFSSRTVDAPTRMTSHSVRSRANTRRSVSEEIPCVTPFSEAAPSAVATMFARSQRPSG